MNKKSIMGVAILIIATMLTAFKCGGGNEPEPEPNLQEKWVWIQGDKKVILDLHQTESKYYTTVEGENQFILFPDSMWTYYKIVNDTMYTRWENGEFPTGNDQFGKWIILQHTDQNFELVYVGTLPTIPIIRNYLFNPLN
jgi:hypothetical protein